MMAPRFFAPEVIQTSAMDCGPATLKCLLEGFGVRVSYGRLREACQTDVDGTSIDVMEEVACRLGLDAEQMMVPADHLMVAESQSFPAILVVQNPGGYTHFIVAWRRVGSWLQVMDPASGRRWWSTKELLDRTFTHAIPVLAKGWREWAASDAFIGSLRARMGRLAPRNERIFDAALKDPSWRSLAALDAATRLIDSLVTAGAISRGAEASRLLATTFDQVLVDLEVKKTNTCIPANYWSAGPLAAEGGEERVLLRGAVLVRARGLAVSTEATERNPPAPLSPELAQALSEPRMRPLQEVFRWLKQDGWLTPGLIAAATVTAALAALVEAVVLRGLFGIGVYLPTWEHRLVAILGLAVIGTASLTMEVPIVSETLRMGRRLELNLRMALFAKIPRLSDRYFASRPTSDMAHRAHTIEVLRQLPQIGARAVRCVADILIVSLGLIWIDLRNAPSVIVVATTCMALPFFAQKALSERDARVRAFNGALTRFYLDSLLGLTPLRCHGAGQAIRHEHENMLGELRRAVLGMLSVATWLDASTAAVSALLTFGLLAHYLARGGDPLGSLLLVYWALSLPVSGAELASVLRQYPHVRNATERVLEPLGAVEEVRESAGADLSDRTSPPATLRFIDVSVRAAGNVILQDVNLSIEAGTHVAIVGPSGAGKSSLCGLLLGWHRAAQGEVEVDGIALRGERIDELRAKTAWVDPGIALWNRTLIENVTYGSREPGSRVSPALESAEVIRLLEQLPDGLQTRLGDGGARVSGGEGQRVRLARAMLRDDSRLVILDEPFRGLDRESRRRLLLRARQIWARATLLCVTHDVGETLDFPRVLVVDGGRVVEDGAPRELAANPHTRYSTLQRAESEVREGMWRGRPWRRLELRAGVLTESHDQVVK